MTAKNATNGVAPGIEFGEGESRVCWENYNILSMSICVSISIEDLIEDGVILSRTSNQNVIIMGKI